MHCVAIVKKGLEEVNQSQGLFEGTYGVQHRTKACHGPCVGRLPLDSYGIFDV